MAEAKKPEGKKPEGKKAETKKAETAKSTKAEPKKSAAKPAAKKEPARKPAAKRAPARKRAAKASPKPAPAEPSGPVRPVVRARARYLRVPPRKARLVADQIRGLGIADARALLDFSSRGAARDLRKLLDSAAANAEANHDLVADDLMVADIHVDDGPTLRRYRPRALGRATRIDKRTSHVSLSLTPED